MVANQCFCCIEVACRSNSQLIDIRILMHKCICRYIIYMYKMSQIISPRSLKSTAWFAMSPCMIGFFSNSAYNNDWSINNPTCYKNNIRRWDCYYNHHWTTIHYNTWWSVWESSGYGWSTACSWSFHWGKHHFPAYVTAVYVQYLGCCGNNELVRWWKSRHSLLIKIRKVSLTCTHPWMTS